MPALNTPDAIYDQQTGTLTIDGIGDGDIVINLARLRDRDEIRALLTTRSRHGNVEDPLGGLNRIVIKRPAI